MSDSIIAVGDIIKDSKSNIRYRVVSIMPEHLVLCEMDTTKFNLYIYALQFVVEMLMSNNFVTEDEENIIFDIETFSENVREKYKKKLGMMNELCAIYGPSFVGLVGRKYRQECHDIMERYNCPENTFNRTCAAYFQSGMKTYSLVDKKAFGANKGKKYQYNSKPGKRSEYLGDTGVLLNEEILGFFEDALKEYKEGRQKSVRSAFDRMNSMHFTKTEIINGTPTLCLLPQTERPTIYQFRYYVEQHLTKQEKNRIKTSAAEQRNNKRLLLSDSLSEVYGPGDMVEIDACEADVSLVSMNDPNKTIGRPIVYFMIDVYSRIILAASVAFDNNSVLGVTNLFLNLADDKQEYCSRFGMGFDDVTLWPSNIIPRRIRVDRGPEFKSKEFERICSELGIEKQLVTGASGSLKGVVEQSFHQMHSRQNVHLEDYGLIEKRYDSEHHKEATLNIEQYTKMVINFVLMHNQQYDENYPLTRDMMDKGVKPIPVLLWQYGTKKYGQPRPIPVKEQYLFNLMTPVKAKVSRRGICYKDLWYFAENDPVLSRDMFNAGTKKVPYEVRMDMRDVSNVYYLRDGRLVTAHLNSRMTGNIDFEGLTMKEWEDYRKGKKQLDAEGRVHNEEISAFNYAVNDSIVSTAKKEAYSDSKDMRPARESEKQLVSSEGKIAARLEAEVPVIESEMAVVEVETKATATNIDDIPESFEEAFARFYDEEE